MTPVDHLIVGAGFGGLCAAIKLDEDGERDYVVIEKGSDVGGTWRDNTYPGAACDVQSHLYSFSFAPNPDWSSHFSPQAEIQAYLQRVARDYGVLDRVVFDTFVAEAAWDEDSQRWTVRTEGPAGTTTYAARTLIAGPGALSEPRLPDIAGIEDFEGPVFHTAQWDHDVDLRGKRVAVIGTGASAIQVIPELQQILQDSGGHLDVYQRTAPWVIPRDERRYAGWQKAAFRRVPGLLRAERTKIYWMREATVPAFIWKPALAAPAKKAALRNIEKGIRDPELRAKVTPTFELGCKRVLISNSYYPALDADNVDLVTDRITRVTGDAIVTAGPDGPVERPVDVLVVATGFYTTDLPIAHQLRGRGGKLLADRFAETGMAAYKGTTVPEFPNLFLIVGPNTGLGHSSMVFIIESQVRYLREALRIMRTNAYATVEPTEQAFADWNADLQARMASTVWSSGGCSSWYLDEHGRNTTLWPRATFTFRRLLSTFDVRSYTVTAGGAASPTTAESVETTHHQENVNA